MTGAEPPRQDRWQHLLSAALAIEDAADPRAEIELRVGSLLEVFHSGLDPVDDFEGYAVRRLGLALRRALQTR